MTLYIVERSVLLLSNRASTKNTENRVIEAGQQLFVQKGSGLDAISPTQAALFQRKLHIKQTIAGNKQVRSLPYSQLPFPRDCGSSSSAKGFGNHFGQHFPISQQLQRAYQAW